VVRPSIYTRKSEIAAGWKSPSAGRILSPPAKVVDAPSAGYYDGEAYKFSEERRLELMEDPDVGRAVAEELGSGAIGGKRGEYLWVAWQEKTTAGPS
jgi:hypothetical protein